MTRREYVCETHGYFEVVRRMSDPVEEYCQKCLRLAEQVYTKAPEWCIAGADGGIPNNSKDEAGYEGWQKDRWAKLEDKLDVRNAGTQKIAVDSLIPKPTFGKDSL